MFQSAVLGYALAGAFLTNGVPHFVKGITGQPHMTLVSRCSSAPFNVVYGAANFALGYLLLRGAVARDGEADPTTRGIAMGAGGLMLAIALAAFWSRPDAKFPWQD